MEQMQSGRIQLLDLSRGIALVAMTIFHFAFDLELLGIKEPGFISQPHWKYFARAIATSFLFLTGMSLLLAHGGGIRWGSWKWRLGDINDWVGSFPQRQVDQRMQNFQLDIDLQAIAPLMNHLHQPVVHQRRVFL